MKIRLLPSHVSDPQHLQPLTSFIVNDVLAIDAGSIGLSLGLDAQRLVRHVIVTHSHADHVATLPILVAETYPFLKQPIQVYATAEVILALRRHVFNDVIWPDFSRIVLPGSTVASLCYREIAPLVPLTLEGWQILPVRTNHTVPTVGLVVDDGRSAVLFTSDTYHTDEIWRIASGRANLSAVFVDVSYANEMESLAAESKHLTPAGLDLELRKLSRTVPVFAVHLKPQFRSVILRELALLGRPNVTVGEIGRDYVFDE